MRFLNHHHSLFRQPGFTAKLRPEVFLRRNFSIQLTGETPFFQSVYDGYKGNGVFAVIKVGGEVIEDDLDTLCDVVSTLKSQDLTPIIVHGGGPQMNDELKKKGVEPNYYEGHRVTDEATLDIAKNVFVSLNDRICSALTGRGLQAVGMPFQAITATPSTKPLGFVGDEVQVNKDRITEASLSGAVPVLSSLAVVQGKEDSGELLNVNADVIAKEVAIAVKPARTFFTSAKGGWIDDDTNEIVDTIDLSHKFEDLKNRDYNGRQGTYLKLMQINDLLNSLPGSSSVSITSAGAILDDLFSFRGSGTLFLKGEKFEPTYLEDATELFPDLQHISSPIKAIYTNASKTAGAVIAQPNNLNFPVVEAVVVPKDSYTTLVNSLWSELKATYPAMGWMIKDNNMANVRNVADQVDDVHQGTLVAHYNLSSSQADKLRTYAIASNSVAPPPATATARVASSVSEEPSRKVKVGLLGARGYVGEEFVRKLLGHDEMELVLASSRALENQRVIDGFNLDESAADNGIAQDLKFVNLGAEDVHKSDVAPEVDVWVLALPNGLCGPYVEPFRQFSHVNNHTGPLLIDLGADFRFRDSWTYGVPERPGTRERLAGTRNISNPGCYATGTQLGLLPLVQFGSTNVSASPLVKPCVFGVSGYSGAGTNPSDSNNVELLTDNLLAYCSVNHIHERESSRHLGAPIAFMPHVASFFRGIHLTMTVQLQKNRPMGNFPTSEQVESHFAKFYANEPLVNVMTKAPRVKDIKNRVDVEIGGFTVDGDTGRLAYVVTIDNLLKGAATQAIQNINLALGMDEFKGILPTK